MMLDVEVVDGTGRRLTVRPLSALDRLRLYKAVGSELAMNDVWFGVAVLATAVRAIEGVPVPLPVSEAQIEALVQRLGDEGLATAAAELDRQVQPMSADLIKN